MRRCKFKIVYSQCGATYDQLACEMIINHRSHCTLQIFWDDFTSQELLYTLLIITHFKQNIQLFFLSGKIHVSIHAEGCEDQPYKRIASVKINTIERSPMGRGMNVVVLDKAGNYLLSKNFDTADPYHAVSEGQRMCRFLNELPAERIVAIASLESVGRCFVLFLRII